MRGPRCRRSSTSERATCEWACSAARPVENFVDLSHFPWPRSSTIAARSPSPSDPTSARRLSQELHIAGPIEPRAAMGAQARRGRPSERVGTCSPNDGRRAGRPPACPGRRSRRSLADRQFGCARTPCRPTSRRRRDAVPNRGRGSDSGVAPPRPGAAERAAVEPRAQARPGMGPRSPLVRRVSGARLRCALGEPRLRGRPTIALVLGQCGLR